MSTIEIAQNSFPWEACATLVTGILAVGAAILVGTKQMAIAAQQVKIVERQTKIQELSVRNDLFDRRFTIYRQTQEILGSIFRSDDEPSGEAINEFWRATDQAQFLFREDVHQEMVAILQTMNKLAICRNHLRGEDALSAGPDRAAYVAMRAKAMEHIYGLGDTLRKTFEPDLSIRG